MKRRIKPWVIIVFMIICLSGVVYSSYNIFIWKDNTNKNSEIKQKIDEAIVVNKNVYNDYDSYEINFNMLKEQNSDTVAYLKVNNTNIDYIVLKGNDNSYYLKHNFNKEYNVMGWIFADYRNKFDGSDKNIVIFGHNIKDGTMFGSLKNVLTKKWFNDESNHIITLVTEESENLYQVFSTYTIEPEDYYITTNFNSDLDYQKFLNTIKSRSIYNYNIDVNTNDTILTLSTCTANGTKRVAVHAKKID